jgi:hypothetical protein
MNLRMKKDTFLSLCRDLRPLLLRKVTRFRRPVSVMKRVAVALWRLSGTAEYRTIAHLFGIGRSTAHQVTREVCNAIVELLFYSYIRLPTGRELEESIEGFENFCGLPQVAGAIDGTHIEIKAPFEYHEDYVNRKGFHSVQLQAVVDSSMRFTDVFVGYPGSVHDARVFSNSPLFKSAKRDCLFSSANSKHISGIDIPVMLVGDSAYPLLPWLLKPFPESPTMSFDKRNFNFKHSSTRMVVERVFGMLKGRWRCLSKCLDDNVENAIATIVACCTLHNYCLVHGDEIEENWLQLSPNEDHHCYGGSHANRGGPTLLANAIRQAIVDYLI